MAPIFAEVNGPQDISQRLQQAVALHSRGELAGAEEIYRQILREQPGQADVLHLLAIVLHQTGRNQEAEQVVQEAIAKRPLPEFYNTLGEVQRAMKCYDAAIEAFARAIELRAEFAEPRQNMALALRAMGRVDEAIAMLREAVKFRPESGLMRFHLASTLESRGSIDDAIAEYRNTIQVAPEMAVAHLGLGVSLGKSRDFAAAVTSLSNAIALQPALAPAQFNLGIAYEQLGQNEAAIAAYRAALSIDPNYADAMYNLALLLKRTGAAEEASAVLDRLLLIDPKRTAGILTLGSMNTERGDFDNAIEHFRRAIAIDPEYADAWHNLALALRRSGNVKDSIEASQNAVRLKPQDPDFHGALSYTLMLSGNYPTGWREYEWRWKCKGFEGRQRSFPQPQWRGEDIAGKTILVHAEQGLGDTIQMIRYAPLLAARGARVVFECFPELYSLLKSVEGISQIVRIGETLPTFDVHIPMMSLPSAFGTTVQTVPWTGPYIKSDEKRVAQWREKLKEYSAKLKVGLAWAGRPTHSEDADRSLHLQQFAPLANLPDVVFFSLQKGSAAAELRDAPVGLNIVDCAVDFAETAALMENLDVVISVDTSIAHLAGAIGTRTWLMLMNAPDFRWLLQREDSPWYPTMKLFRQDRTRTWAPVIQRLADELKRLR